MHSHGFIIIVKIENEKDKKNCNNYTVAQKTAPMFAYYIKTHVLLNANITSLVYILNHVIWVKTDGLIK